MSRINDLIKKCAPGGVEYKPLGELGTFVRGNGLQKKDFVDQGFPCIHYGQIYTYYGISTTSTKSFVTDEHAVNLRRAKPGDLVIATTSENLEDVGKAVAWLGDGEVAFGGHTSVFRHGLEPKYVAHFFQSASFHKQKKKHVSGTKVKELPFAGIAKIRIAVPPIEVQREIVRTLDAFTELGTELEAELESELEARRQQFAHYREALLSSTKIGGVRWATLAELGRWTGGVTPSKYVARYWDEGTIPWATSMDISATAGREVRGRVAKAALAETSLRIVPAPSVAVVMRSNVLRRFLPVGYVQVDTTVNQDLRVLQPYREFDARYVYHALQAASEAIRSSCVRTDGSMAAVESKAFFNWRIPVPTLEEQQRIVEVLDEFGALLDDLSSRLPAEIEGRRQQYAYYRDRLLTFDEAAP